MGGGILYETGIHYLDILQYLIGNPTEVLLKTSGSQKFSFEGEILDIVKTDVIYIAIISIGQQLVEVVLCEDEAKDYKAGDKVRVGTKAFAPTLNKI